MTHLIVPQYHLISPESYTTEHRCFLEVVRESIGIISAQTNMIMGVKDIHSRPLISIEGGARVVESGVGPGCINGDLPCDANAEFAGSYIEEDQALLRQTDINKKISVLGIHHHRNGPGTGPNAFLVEIQLLKHHPSRSILGTIYNAREIEMPNFFSFIPNYVLEFGMNCRIENSNGATAIGHVRLSEYEHEVCYLLTMNWSCKQIAEFLNKYRPKTVPRGVDTIYKCRNRICDKLGLTDYNTTSLREHLISLGMHKKMPQSFFNHLPGLKVVDRRPIGF